MIITVIIVQKGTLLIIVIIVRIVIIVIMVIIVIIVTIVTIVMRAVRMPEVQRLQPANALVQLTASDSQRYSTARPRSFYPAERRSQIQLH